MFEQKYWHSEILSGWRHVKSDRRRHAIHIFSNYPCVPWPSRVPRNLHEGPNFLRFKFRDKGHDPRKIFTDRFRVTFPPSILYFRLRILTLAFIFHSQDTPPSNYEKICTNFSNSQSSSLHAPRITERNCRPLLTELLRSSIL
jgi:hypothetical protein